MYFFKQFLYVVFKNSYIKKYPLTILVQFLLKWKFYRKISFFGIEELLIFNYNLVFILNLLYSKNPLLYTAFSYICISRNSKFDSDNNICIFSVALIDYLFNPRYIAHYS